MQDKCVILLQWLHVLGVSYSCVFYKQGQNLDREAKFKDQSRVRTREDEKTERDKENQKERGGLLEVDDLSQRGAFDWSCSQGRLDDLADGQFIFANEGIDHVGEVFELAQHTHTARVYS